MENNLTWGDNSAVSFTNWADNNPKNLTDYNCIQMSLVAPYYGNWLNEPCNQSYLVVCQKYQNWLFSYMQQTVLGLRETMEKTNINLLMTNNDLQNTKTELKNTKVELQNTKTELQSTKSELSSTRSYLEKEIVKSTPSGTIAYFVSTAAPTGWLKANGDLVSRSTYASLFSSISSKFGSGDGSTTFALPDLRGEFIRGWSDGRDVDKTRSMGSFQMGSIIPFAGGINNTWGAGSFAHQNRYGWLAGNTFDDGFDDIESGKSSKGITYPNDKNNNEMYYVTTPNKGFITNWYALRGTRPRNIALLACIKY